jgi:hypothetical protein
LNGCDHDAVVKIEVAPHKHLSTRAVGCYRNTGILYDVFYPNPGGNDALHAVHIHVTYM